MLKFTVLDSLETTEKIPISPRRDNTFRFINVEVPLDNVHKLCKNYFILSRPLKVETQGERNADTLEELYDINSKYVIIDFDHVKNNTNRIIDYFSNNNYVCNVFKSRKNIKAVVEVNFLTNQTNIRAFLNMIQSHLDGLCVIDLSSSNRASYQAPILREELLHINTHGYRVVLDDIEKFIKTYEPIPDYNDISVDWFKYRIIQYYNGVFKPNTNPNGSINLSLPIEQKSKFSYFWSPSIPWVIQHPNNTKNINMMGDFVKSEQGKIYFKQKKLDRFKDCFNNFNSTYSIRSRYFYLDDGVKDVVGNFDVLFIKGIMGSGKSTIIEYINKPKTLFISMRVSLSYDIKDKYKCKHYIDDITKIKTKESYRFGDSLVVQVDSLHKVDLKYFDQVVIDEFESFCLYTQSNMVDNSNYIVNMRMIKNIFETKQLIIADAFLNTFSKDLYFNNRDVKIIDNTYKDTSKVFQYEHKHTFINVLEQTVLNKNDDEIITCSFGTLKEMGVIKKLLEEKNIKVININAKIPKEARELVTDLFKLTDVKSYDVVLFSPTITVGISILNNVKHHFHYDVGKSIDVISSIQMTKRSRKAKYIHVYLEGRDLHLKTTNVEDLNKETLACIENARESYMFNYDINDISELGKFINKFKAHSNFYYGNNKDIVNFLLTIQFNTIDYVGDKISHSKFDKIKRSMKKEEYFIPPNKKLDLEDYDRDYSKNNLSLEGKSYQLCLYIKDITMLDDDMVVSVAKEYVKNKKILDYIRNLQFLYTNNKDNHIENLSFKTVNNILNGDVAKDLKILVDIPFKLYEHYSKTEAQDLMLEHNNFVKIIKLLGYRRKNGGYNLPNILKKIINIKHNN